MPIINMVYKKKKWWKPWANTIAYWKLESDTNDYSWNSRNLTNNWITFTTSWTNINVWYFSWNTYCQIADQVALRWYSSMTISLWAKYYGSWWEAVAQDFLAKWLDTTDGAILMRVGVRSDIKNRIEVWVVPVNWSNGRYAMWTTTFLSWWWHNIVLVLDNKINYVYYDWTLLASTNNSSYTYSFSNTWALYVWRAWNGSWREFKWYVSHIIYEKVARTAQEVSDYYNQTKWNYWL